MHRKIRLSFGSVSGEARILLVQAAVQKAKDLGYQWHSNSHYTPKTLGNIFCLFFYPKENDMTHLSFDSMCAASVTFSAATQWEEWVTAMTPPQEIKGRYLGVDYTVSKEEISLDCSELMAAVNSHAKEIQQANFKR